MRNHSVTYSNTDEYEVIILSFLSIDPCMAKECGSSRKCSVTADKEAVCGMI
jgi:hypothetical protein